MGTQTVNPLRTRADIELEMVKTPLLTSEEEETSTKIDTYSRIEDGLSEKRFFAQVAMNCTVIQETGVMLYNLRYNPGSTCLAKLVASHQMTKIFNTFSIRILKTGQDGCITIGLVPENYSAGRQPGWDKGSIGYHSDDGGIYVESGNRPKMTKAAKEGDIMSFHLDTEKKVGYFKKNNVEIAKLIVDPQTIGLYPCVTIDSEGGTVQILDDVQNEFKLLFGDFDKDRDGRLTQQEFKSCLQSMGWEFKDGGVDSDFQEVLNIVDPSSSGYITQDSFKNFSMWSSLENKSPLPSLPPSLSTEKYEDLWISPPETISLMKVNDSQCYRGWLSLHNPSKRPVAFRILLDDSVAFVEDGKGNPEILRAETTWVEYLSLSTEHTECGSITIEWTALEGRLWSYNDEELDKIFQERKSIIKAKKLATCTKAVMAPQSSPINTELEEVKASILDEKDNIDSVDTVDAHDFARCLAGDTNIEMGDTSEILLMYLEKQSWYALKEEKSEVVQNVEKILKRATKLNIKKQCTGFTPLHYAASLRLCRVAALLLDAGADPHIGDINGRLPLQYAIESGDDKLGRLLVRKMKTSSIRDLFLNETITELTIKKLLEKGLQRTVVAVLDAFHGKVGFDRDYFVLLELDDNKRCPENTLYNTKHETAYQKICCEEIKAVVCHAYVKALTQRKWKLYAGKIFMIMALVYLLSLFSLTFAAITGVLADDVTQYHAPIDIARAVFEILAFIYAVITTIIELLQLFKRGPKRYLTDVFNYMEFGSSILILSVLPLRFTHCIEQWYVFAFGYILWTFRIFKYAAMFRTTGIFGQILLGLIIYDVPKFVVLFLIVLLSFSGGLLLSLKGDNNLSVHEETSTFWGILVVGVRTMTEAQSVVDYTGPEGFRTVSSIVMLLFLFITCVLLLNILIAQLSDRFAELQKDAQRVFEISRARIVARIERNDELTCFYWGQALWKKYFPEKLSVWEVAGKYEQGFDDDISLEKVAMEIKTIKASLVNVQTDIKEIKEAQQSIQILIQNMLKITQNNSVAVNSSKQCSRRGENKPNETNEEIKYMLDLVEQGNK